MRRLWRWLALRTGSVALFMGILAWGSALAFLGFSNHNFAACLQYWARVSTQRTDALLGATNERNEALDRLIRDVAGLPAARAAFARDLQLYIVASDAYRVQLVRHPVPPAPKENC